MGYGLLGFKALVYRQGGYYSFMRSQRWDHGWLTGRCFKPQVDWPYTAYACDVPERRCRCGIYAVAPFPDKAIEYVTTRDVVLTVVRAHRKTVRHQKGWRAAMAEVVAIVMPETYWYTGIYHPHELPLSASLLAADVTAVPLIDMAAARALVESSWDHYSQRLWIYPRA